eukprot:TRINITY_DN9511_c0_g1_i1.p1 TRINITY_DN9511_c0_g1~~TRINITY_DN9511_c0_g1_i1.p1  ORF type:complete len:290 (-),score=91.69 TRINITY_DN9511_c0_g1_i1:102-971(-)
MGGDYYSREMSDTADNTYSSAAATTFKREQQDPYTDPAGRTMHADVKNPVVVCMDITGSMGDFPRVIFDKLPMFYGQIMMQGYLQEPACSFSFYAHASGDRIPMQVTEFCQGNAIDEALHKMMMYSCGGGDEGLEYPAFFYAYRTTVKQAEDGKGFLFFIGDSLPSYPVIKKELAAKILGVDIEHEIPVDEVFHKLRSKYEVFFICRIPTTHGLEDGDIPKAMKEKWSSWVGAERILKLTDPKAVVDIMLGALSTVSGARSWKAYFEDMKTRGQTEQRIDMVHQAFGLK